MKFIVTFNGKTFIDFTFIEKVLTEIGNSNNNFKNN